MHGRRHALQGQHSSNSAAQIHTYEGYHGRLNPLATPHSVEGGTRLQHTWAATTALKHSTDSKFDLPFVVH